ncbi:type I DNA topoisomerase [Candidatus Palauibacter sp.]|uniref:type I DNA topoisomerase n=1 Tax=Candidatus Palauibacter sp. TaxID=3101350 RepID=UPI003AF29457
MKLLIVESPAKARTLKSYLGDGFSVEASVGHVRDLPRKGLGVDVERGFEPEYVTIEGKGPVLKKLRDAAEKAESILLATDPDREGEAIAYHIVEALSGRKKSLRQRFRRITFNEITKNAVVEALDRPGEIDLPRIEAQQARRILDRLVGYKVSPLLWKKIRPGLSAGRVQSVAVRLLVERERERRAFRSGTYWDLRAHLAAEGRAFTADLATLEGAAIAKGRDFDERTGALKAGRRVVLLDQDRVEALRASLADATFTVGELREKRSKRSPYPPFTTATLQQEANRKLNLGARETMRIAQGLYEAGRITYMRTDSVTLSEVAIGAIRSRVETRYGAEYLSPSPRRYKTRSRSAQEAHEAIRPAGTEMATSRELGLTGRQEALYDLIWRRATATQMADARLRHLTVRVDADDARFRAAGKVIEFPGFFRAYVEGSDDPDAALENQEVVLPDMREGQELACRKVESRKHETKPPARFTDAALVKELEADGIGRPSTYAAIISTVLDRGYAVRQNKHLVPTFIAFAVTELLENHFQNLVDTGFTSEMEEALDEIARGNVDWRSYLAGFYNGRDGLEARLLEREAAIDPREASTVRLGDLTPRVRIGRYGPYLELELDGARTTAPLPEGVAPADLSEEQALELLKKRAQGPDRLGEDPESGETIYLMDGRYGPYVQCGEAVKGGGKPRRASLPANVLPEDVTLATALKLLAMPAPLGTHPESGEPVKVGIGRYGPYVVHQSDYRSLTDGDDPLDITFDRAMELLAVPKTRGRRAAAKPLRTVGEHPDDGQPIAIHKGRYGPYVKHGRMNASLPKGLEPDDVTVTIALELLRKRRERDAAKTGSGRRGPQGKSSRK